MLRPFVIMALALYAGIVLLVTLEQAVKKKSVKFTKTEWRWIFLQTLIYATVMLVATYAYYFFGVNIDPTP